MNYTSIITLGKSLALGIALLLFTQNVYSQQDSLANVNNRESARVLIDLGIGGPSTTFLLAQIASFGEESFSSTPVFEGRVSAIVTDIEGLFGNDSDDYLAIGLGVNYYSMSYEYPVFEPEFNDIIGFETSEFNRLNVGVQGTYNLKINDWLRVYAGIGLFYGAISGSKSDERIKEYMSANIFPGMPIRIAYQEFAGGAIQITDKLAFRAEINLPGTSILSAGLQLKL